MATLTVRNQDKVKEQPSGKDRTLPELCRMQPFVNAIQSRR
jgi:hypothetical protein